MLNKLKSLLGMEKSFGIYVEDRSIKIMQVKEKDGELIVHSLGERKIDGETVKDGLILKEKTLAEEIKTLLTEVRPNPVDTKQCVCALQEGQIFEHIFYLPANLNEEQFKVSLEKLIEETIPVPFYEIQYDYSTTLHGNVQVVFVVAVRRLIVAQYYEVLKNFCELDPVAFEPAFLSLIRSLPYNLKQDKGNIVIYLENGKLNWFTIWGEDVFDSSTMTGEGLKNLPTELIEDLSKSIDYFGEVTNRKVDNILIAGNVAEAIKIKQILDKGLKVPSYIIEKYRVESAVDEQSDPSKFNVVSGVALRDIRGNSDKRFNLLKKNK